MTLRTLFATALLAWGAATASAQEITLPYGHVVQPDQKLVQDAAIEAGAYQKHLSREATVQARRQIEVAGMQVNDVPPATLAKRRELTQPVAEKFAASSDPAAVRLYRAELEKVRAAIR